MIMKCRGFIIIALFYVSFWHCFVCLFVWFFHYISKWFGTTCWKKKKKTVRKIKWSERTAINTKFIIFVWQKVDYFCLILFLSILFEGTGWTSTWIPLPPLALPAYAPPAPTHNSRHRIEGPALVNRPWAPPQGHCWSRRGHLQPHVNVAEFKMQLKECHPSTMEICKETVHPLQRVRPHSRAKETLPKLLTTNVCGQCMVWIDWRSIGDGSTMTFSGTLNRMRTQVLHEHGARTVQPQNQRVAEGARWCGRRRQGPGGDGNGVNIIPEEKGQWTLACCAQNHAAEGSWCAGQPGAQRSFLIWGQVEERTPGRDASCTTHEQVPPHTQHPYTCTGHMRMHFYRHMHKIHTG